MSLSQAFQNKSIRIGIRSTSGFASLFPNAGVAVIREVPAHHALAIVEAGRVFRDLIASRLPSGTEFVCEIRE